MNTGLVLTHEQIEEACFEKSIKKDWGWEVYEKKNSEWALAYYLVTEETTRTTHKIYPDSRPSEIIKWGNAQ